MTSLCDLGQLRLIFNAVNDFIAYVDPEERFVFVNRAFEAWFRLGSEQIVGRKLADVMRDHGLATKLHLSSALHGCETRFEMTLSCPNSDEPKVLDVQYIPYRNELGEVRGVVILGHDVTERKRTEESLEKRVHDRVEEIRRSRAFLDSVVENIPNMIFVKDAANLKFVSFNRAGEELLGLPREQLIGRSDYDFFPKEQADFFIANDREVLASGTLRDIPEEPIETASKGSRILHTKKIPILGSDGEPEYLLGISEDITDAKALQEQTKKAQEAERLYREAQAVNKVKDDFLATLSHELRTPLNVICGRADLLMKDIEAFGDDEIAESVRAIHRNARIQAQIIDDLLDVSSILIGKVNYRPELVRMSDHIYLSVEAVRRVAREKGVRLRTEIEYAAEPVKADPTRLSQIFMNLLSNAVKFTPAGGSVTVRAFLRGNSHVVEFEDTGVGIDPDFLPRVFDRFRQEEGSSARRFSGLGLGLSIVRHLVELHGGSIRAESEGKGKGSRFRVDFPVAEASEHEIVAPVKEAAGAPRRMGPEPLKGLKVLLVDDSEDSRDLAEAILTKAGAAVSSADSAAAARTHLHRETPDVIVSDIGMPDEDGYEFIRNLRRGNVASAVPAIALSAYVRGEEVERALRFGFQAHVPKPVDFGLLVETIAKLAKTRVALRAETSAPPLLH